MSLKLFGVIHGWILYNSSRLFSLPLFDFLQFDLYLAIR